MRGWQRGYVTVCNTDKRWFDSSPTLQRKITMYRNVFDLTSLSTNGHKSRQKVSVSMPKEFDNATDRGYCIDATDLVPAGSTVCFGISCPVGQIALRY